MASPQAVLQEILLRPRWAWHRWRDGREHVHRSGSHQERMADYERHVTTVEDAIARTTGASPAKVRATVAAMPHTPREAEAGAIPAWNDSTAELAAVLYALVRLRRPRSVVETGVARGVSSAAILQALEDNGEGRLWSLDLPGLGAGYREQVGHVVPERLRARWTLALGPSAVRLPRLLGEAAPVDLFVHDSAHTYRNMRFEFGQAARRLAPGGLLVSDDVCNDSLLEFAEAEGWPLVTVRQSKPAPWTYIGLARKPA